MNATLCLRRWLSLSGFGVWLLLGVRVAIPQAPAPASSEFEKYARGLREKALQKIAPSVVNVTPGPAARRTRFPWKTNIVTTVFWVSGSNAASAWDEKRAEHYGGSDNPKPSARQGFIPVAFVPKQNPFYCSLPYNDVTARKTKPEARLVIPWFKESFSREGSSVCRDRWVRIRNSAGRDCYAQWSDCGPFVTDHWQYVFGDERPRPNANQGAGLGISPAVRDYLGVASTDVTDWKFINFRDVPRGPWSSYGENNSFLQQPPEEHVEPVATEPTVIEK